MSADHTADLAALRQRAQALARAAGLPVIETWVAPITGISILVEVARAPDGCRVVRPAGSVPAPAGDVAGHQVTQPVRAPGAE